MKNKIIILSSILFLVGMSVHAAQIKFETSAMTVSVGDTVVFHVRLNTAGTSINAVDLGILYPKLLAVENISKLGSALQLWVNEPSYTGEAILLSGGTPSAITSDDALIATITFQAKAVGDGALGLSPASSVLLNDGHGTSVSISLVTPTIHVVARQSNQAPRVMSGDVSAKQAKSDFVRPNSFDLAIGSDARLFSNKYFISFFTTDSGSGVDHYELKEGDAAYVIARSPYLLSDQSLHSVIHMRAYDVAGNYREEVYPNIFIRFWWWISKYVSRLHL